MGEMVTDVLLQAKRHSVQGAQLLTQARSAKSRSAATPFAKEALVHADQAIALDPKDATAHVLKASILDFQGFKTSALDSLDAALSPLAAKSLSAEERGDALYTPSSRCLLGDKEVVCRENESGIRELKQKSFNLNSSLRKLEIQKAELVHQEILSSDDTYTSESECSDMSDDDWVNSAAVKKNRKSNRGRPSRVPSTGGNCSLTSANGFGAGFSCFCSKASFCKTIRCQCRAIGGSCGSLCRCLLSKCTNRDGKSEQDVQSQLQDEENGNGSEIDETYRNLASHAAMLLQRTLADKSVEARAKASDIGNTLLHVAEGKLEELNKGHESLIKILAKGREKRDEEKKKLRKDLKDALNIIQELLEKAE